MTNVSIPSPAAPSAPEKTSGRSQAVPAARPGWLGRLPVGRKIALASLMLAIPYLIVNYYLRQIVTDSIRVLSSQQIGQQMLLPSAQLLQNTQLVRLSSVNMLNGQVEAQKANADQRTVINQALSGMLKLAQSNNLPDLAVAIQTASAEMLKLHEQVDTRTLSATQAQAAYSKYLADYVQPLFLEIAHASSLNLSPNATREAGLVQQLVPLVTDTMPQNLPNAGAIVSGNVQLINRLGGLGKKVDEASRVEAQLRWDRANEARQRILAGYRRAIATDPELKTLLTPAYQKLATSSDPIFNKLQVGLVTSPTVQVQASTLNELTPAYAQGLFGGLETGIKALGMVIAKEKKSAESQLMLSNIVPPLALALFGLLFFLITRSITRPLGLLTDGSRRLSSGDLNVQIPVTTADEIGTLAGSFNTAAAQLRANAEKNELERQEAARLQRHIGEFLDVTMDIAEGDLTKRGKVTEDVLGNVVDSINLMAEELGSVLKNVQHTTSSVTSTSHTMRSSTELIQQGTQRTLEESQRMAGQMQQATQTIQQMAQNAQTSADTARQVLHASEQGQQAVVSTLDGMQNIRREVQGIAKRIKGLGDRSLEIQEIVDTIARFSRRTHLLSLNAAVEAAGVGEAGSRFHAVAEEVRQLSETSGQATTRIAGLIKNVQAEIQDVIASVEEGAQEVEQGYQVAGQAGERLREISTLTQQSAQLAQSVAASSQQQAQDITAMSGAVAQIASLANEAQQSVDQGRQAAADLERLAQQLSEGLSRFRLS